MKKTTTRPGLLMALTKTRKLIPEKNLYNRGPKFKNLIF
jgi:hypothetical protein